MSVGRDDVRRIAALARLELAEEELDRLTDDLNGILDHVDALRSADLSGASDLDPHIAGARPWARDLDVDAADRLAAGPEEFAPELAQGFFVVPPLPGFEEGA